MATVTTDKTVNLGQLLGELGMTSGTLRADDAAGTVEVDVPEADEATLSSAVDAHTAAAPGPDARERFRQAVQDATSLDDLKAALLGTNIDAEPDVRPRGR